MKDVKQTSANLLNDIAFSIKRKVKHDRLYHLPINPHADEALALIEALKADRYEFKEEVWHNIGRQQIELPSEMLLRAYKENQEKISPQDPITFINNHGEHAHFDHAIILLSVAQALSQNLPYISINTSARNTRIELFWIDIPTLLQSHFGDGLKNVKLVFEITEDSLAKDTCRAVLLEMKDKWGYEIAIDDALYDRKGKHTDVHRLHNLAARRGYKEYDSEGRPIKKLEKGLADFVKIDGSVIRDAFDRLATGDGIDAVKREMKEVTDEIRSLFPRAMIIAEKVRSQTEIEFLRDHTDIDAVQGQMLPKPNEEPALQIARTRNNPPGTQPS